jgi:RNA polymerase sigma factor (sigma-70 family)
MLLPRGKPFKVGLISILNMTKSSKPEFPYSLADNVRLYFHQSQHTLLTREQEYQLGERMKQSHCALTELLLSYQDQKTSEHTGRTVIRGRLENPPKYNRMERTSYHSKNIHEKYLTLEETLVNIEQEEEQAQQDKQEEKQTIVTEIFNFIYDNSRRSALRLAAKDLLDHVNGRISKYKKGPETEDPPTKEDYDSLLIKEIEFQQDLAKQYRIAKETSQSFVRKNLKLAVSIAKHWTTQDYGSFLDLIEEANIGLMKVVDKFDHTRGNKFSTYATYWIKQNITRSLSEGNFVHVGTTDTDKHDECYVEAEDIFTERIKQGISVVPNDIDKIAAEVAKEKGYDHLRIRAIEESRLPPRSIDFIYPDRSGGSFAEINDIDPNQEKTPETFMFTELSCLLRRVLTQLEPREEKVVRMRTGFGEARDYTLEETGQFFGVTRERARQLESGAYKKMMKKPIAHRLIPFLEDLESLCEISIPVD